MIKKEIFIGFMVGLIANSFGLILAALIFGQSSNVFDSIKISIADGFFGKLVSMGAILNLVAFFMFLKIKRDYRARGVLLATVFIAIATFIINYT